MKLIDAFVNCPFCQSLLEKEAELSFNDRLVTKGCSCVNKFQQVVASESGKIHRVRFRTDTLSIMTFYFNSILNQNSKLPWTMISERVSEDSIRRITDLEYYEPDFNNIPNLLKKIKILVTFS